MNNATKAFFKAGSGVVLAVYDTRRGQVEGREAEKILAFYPPTAPPAMQSSIVGLAQALTMFAGTFNKECPFHTMEAQGHIWAMYHAEPDLWLLLVVGRGLVGPDCLASSLTGLVKGLHSVAVLLHGLLSMQLQQDPSGVRVRRRLQPLLQEGAASLLQPDPAGLWSISCPLGLTGGVPMLPVPAAAFTRMQSLTNSLLVARVFSCRPVLGVLVAWQTCLLWSSLGSSDTAALHSLAVRGLEPAVREGPRHKTLRRPLAATSSHQYQHQQQPTAATGAAAGSSRSFGSSNHPPGPQTITSSSSSLHPDSVCLANPACWYCRPDGLLLPVAPTSGGSSGDMNSSGGGAGELHDSDSIAAAAAAATAAAAVDALGASKGCAELPIVWLQSGSERARLMAWHSGPLLLLLLLEANGPPASSCRAVTASLLDLLADQGAALSSQLTAELPAKHLWHVKGLRYLYQDHLAAAVRASPLRKVATLSQASLHLTANARRWAAAEVAAAADPTAPALGEAAVAAAAAAGPSVSGLSAGSAAAGLLGGGGGGIGSSSSSRALAEQWEAFAAGGGDADVELVIKGAHDCWVVGKHTSAGRQLTAVVEGDKDKGLLGVMRRVQGFCDSEVPGVFEGLS